jgi:hypothetical protein
VRGARKTIILCQKADHALLQRVKPLLTYQPKILGATDFTAIQQKMVMASYNSPPAYLPLSKMQ